MALTDKLTAIGNAIRDKTGSTEKMTLDEMPTAINSITTGGGEGGGYDIPDEAFVLSGSKMYYNYGDNMSWFLEQYGNKITTKDLWNCQYMFSNSATLRSIPFNLNFRSGYNSQVANIFNGCNELTVIGDINNLVAANMVNMFSNCYKLKTVPNFNNLDMSYFYSYTNASCGSMFSTCRSLLSIPENLLKQLYTPKATVATSTLFYYGFQDCYVLGELVGLNPQTGIIKTNAFNTTFECCNRLKDIIFVVQDDGSPYVAQWKTQTIDLSDCVGYCNTNSYNVTSYKAIHGINVDKKVTDADTYAALKDDPYWWTDNIAYSRYNHDSAVNTINSLPDTSAYLASAGGTNTIKFKGEAGSATDGGAINTLTEEEIAVAAAKGWTVSFV